MKKSRAILGGALVLTLLAAYFAPEEQGEVLPVRPGPQRHSFTQGGGGKAVVTTGVQVPAVLAILPRQDEGMGGQDAFPSMSWTPPPPPASEKALEPAELPPPQAPPLPFKALGQYVEAGTRSVFLQFNDANLVVHVGDTIAGQYFVESLKGGVLTLVYLPLQQRQTLTVSVED